MVYFEEGATYYFHKPAFLTKLSLFIIVGLLSVIPTLEFLSWRGALQGRARAGDGRRQAAARHGDRSR